MPWDDIFKRLTGASKGVLGSLTDSLNGGREYTPEDALTVSKGPQENRGIGNILQNISLIGAQRRKASRDLAWEREDREISNDLKRAQIEDQKSEAAYRRGLLNIQERKFDIQAERSNVLNLKTEAEIQFAKANLEVKAMNAATAARQAQTQADLAQTAVEKQQWEKIRDERNFEYRQAQDFIKNDLEQRRVDIQAGYLNLAREKTRMK